MDDIPLPLPFLLGGAIDWILPALGLPQDACPARWMADHPELLGKIQAQFLAAGATVLCAPTGKAGITHLAPFCLEDQTEEISRTLLEQTRLAAGEAAKVYGVLSATGLKLPPQGEATVNTLAELYAKQVRAMAQAGADGFLLDCVASVAEARAGILAVRENTDKPVVVTFACDGEGRTDAGTDILAGLIVCQGMGASAFGIGAFYGDLADLLEQITRLSAHTNVPLVICPGDKDGHAGLSPEAFAAAAPILAEAGVRYFGGGGSAPHIEALRSAMDAIDFARLPPPPSALDSDTLPCACAREARFISPLIDVGDGIECSPHFVEDLLTSEDTPTGALKVILQEEDDLDIFAENQYMIQEALCLSSDNPALLEQALRLYNGRAFYDGMDHLEPDVLSPLIDKYGLVVL